MSDNDLTQLAWTDCPDCGVGQEHDLSVHNMPKTVVMHCECEYVSEHQLDQALGRWDEVEEARHFYHMWDSE